MKLQILAAALAGVILVACGEEAATRTSTGDAASNPTVQAGQASAPVEPATPEASAQDKPGQAATASEATTDVAKTEDARKKESNEKKAD